MNNEKLLLEDIKKLKVSLSRNADSFDFLKNYLIDNGIMKQSEFEYEHEVHMNKIYNLSGDLIIEEYNLTIGENN